VSLNTISAHFANFEISTDLDRSSRAFHPEYYGFAATSNAGVWVGMRIGGIGSFASKIISIAAMMTAAPWLCALWLLAELAFVMVVRGCFLDQWRGHLPRTSSVGPSLLLAFGEHVLVMMAPAPSCRIVVGRGLWALFSVYAFLANPAMLACALSIDSQGERIRLPNASAHLWVALGLGSVLYVVGFGMVWVCMVPAMRHTFSPWHQETIREYLSRCWETRTASRVGWGNNIDAARAHVVVSWSHHFWPLEKVTAWLEAKWPLWKHQPPPWFTVKWRAKLKLHAPLGLLPPVAIRHIAQDEQAGGVLSGEHAPSTHSPRSYDTVCSGHGVYTTTDVVEVAVGE